MKFEYKFNCRAGEVASFPIGQLLSTDKVKFTIISESMSKKAITIVLLQDTKPEETLIKHINIKGRLTYFDLKKEISADARLLKQFNVLEVSAPEDANFRLLLSVS